MASFYVSSVALETLRNVVRAPGTFARAIGDGRIVDTRCAKAVQPNVRLTENYTSAATEANATRRLATTSGRVGTATSTWRDWHVDTASGAASTASSRRKLAWWCVGAARQLAHGVSEHLLPRS